MPAPSPILQFRRGSAATIASGIATFRAGEPGFTTDKYDLYVGSNNTASGNKFFGSARYWSREDATNSAQIRLVDKDGSNYIAIAASNTLVGVATYRFPNTNNGTTGDFLKVKSVSGGYYDLEWSPVPSGSFTIAGDTGTDTFTTGETLTFAGTTAEIETSITNNQVKIGLPNNVTITGVITATTFSGNATNATYAISAGIATYATTAGLSTNATYAVNAGVSTYAGTAGVSTSVNGGVASVTQLNVTGVSTLGVITSTSAFFTGIITANSFSGSFSGNATSATYAVNAGVATYAGTAGLSTNATYAVNAGVSTYAGTAGISTRSNSVDVVGVATNQNYYITLVDSSGNSKSVGVDSELLYNPNTNTLTVGTGVGVTQFTSSVSSGATTSSVPTSSAVINYVQTQVGAVDLTLGLTADTGGPSTVNTSQTLTISGTTNQVQTTVSGQTVTVSLPNTVVVGTSVSAPTIKASSIQHSNGTSALSIDTAGNVTSLNNLTVSGNLFVNGNTTQVNTSELQVNDRTITLGIQSGTTATTTTWDLGVLMNYGDAGTAKTSGVIWESANKRFQFAEDSNNLSGINTDTPQITVAAFSPIEIKSLYINNACSNNGGSVEVVGCRDSGYGSELQLMNIVVDGGSF